MAKQSTSCCGEEGRTLEEKKKKKKRAAFSETELDAARQLVQLSGNSDENDGSTKKEKEEDGTEASSAFQDVALLFGENEADHLMRPNRKYRSIQHIYGSTKPIGDAVHAKRMRCN
ncbi:hypothetical protein ACJRO7_036177 [Eucalyptus globulus]|uniref:Uncharacterized protein n=1 Tax=Eucalyptus globulus TaxID=34317 RepID=A0ABD3JBN0_EUCGL